MEDIQNQILLIIVCLFFSGLFSGLEIAFISRDKLNFEIKSNTKSFFGFRRGSKCGVERSQHTFYLVHVNFGHREAAT